MLINFFPLKNEKVKKKMNKFSFLKKKKKEGGKRKKFEGDKIMK